MQWHWGLVNKLYSSGIGVWLTNYSSGNGVWLTNCTAMTVCSGIGDWLTNCKYELSISWTSTTPTCVFGSLLSHLSTVECLQVSERMAVVLRNKYRNCN